MPTFIPSATATAAPAQPAAQPGARGRFAGDDDGRSFGAVLERSRAGARRAQDDADTASPTEAAATPQRPGRGAARKEEPGSELLTIALFTPQMQANAPAVAAGRTGAAAKAAPATTLPGTADVALAGTATAPAAGTAADGTADALPTTAEAAAKDAKAPPAGASAAAAPAAADASAAPADPVPTLPRTQPAAAKTDALAPQAGSAAAVPPAGAQPSAPATAGSTTASTDPTGTAKTQAGPDAALAPEAAQPAAPASAAVAQQSDTQVPSAPTVLAAATPMQPALDRAQPTTAPAATPSLAPPVGSPEWAPALGHQMLRMRAGGQQVAELSLNPAGLGPLKITLGVGDNQVQAMFVSAHESVRKAVEAALPQLRSSLAEQGISLGQTSVGAESRPWAGMGGGFAQQQEQRQPSSGPASAYPGTARGADAAATSPLPARAAIPSRTSGVDTFA